MGIGQGDAVFVPDFTFFATAEAVAMASATALSAIDAQPDARPMTNAQISTAAVITMCAAQMAVVPPINLYRYGTFHQMIRM